ncbi:MAG: BlaI/MecI/CopY family transcriptional regulator [Saprospiraceae bacterium]|nr:BlaI/MecI/CopY family transcriptional regulator [Saprospiraceae bacterium]
MQTSSHKPTEAELEILQVLWAQGASTVRQVNEEINKSKPDVGYTTTLKLMQIMKDKGLVHRDTSSRQHIYQAAVEEGLVQDGMVKNVIDRFFHGSAKRLIMHTLGQEEPTAEELDEIKKLIQQIESEVKE